ncbi:hypothetical protein Taro_052368 [Colocasia esculenta]|uniref:Uncharacterized protein n=1 Tax=Colocasia esculenta TaxID=4460 RepID=A0A843XIE7_COLES|nr:hypothetical protein [Colocasia esculenta]
MMNVAMIVSGSECFSRDGSRLRRHRTLSVPLPPTSQAIPPPPTSQGLPPALTSQELPLPLTLQQIAPSSNPQGSSMTSTSSVAGPSAPSAPSWGRGTGHRGPTRGVTEKRLPDGQQWNVSLIRGYDVGPTADHFTSRMGVLTYQWERTEKTDRKMLAHMSAMHRSWHSKQKKRHFNGKSLDDVIASVPTGVNSSDWQSICEMWSTGDEREAMTRMIAPSSDVDAKSHTPSTTKDIFISVMGKDRLGRVRCVGSGETLSTWYRST